MLGLLVLSLGCQAPPSQLGGDASSSGSPPGETSGGSTSAGEGTTLAAGSSSSGPQGSSSADGGSSSGDDGNSSSGEPVDDPLGPFDAPVAVDMLNGGADEDDPTLTGDLLEIYFASTRNGSEDVFMSTRASVDAPWDAPVAVDSLNSFAQETFPEVSLDGLLIVLASNRPGASGLDIYVSRRGSRGSPWPEPVPVTPLNTPMEDYGATPSPNLMSVFLCRVDQPGGVGQADIWRAAIDFQGLRVQPPELVGELSTTHADCSVTVSESEREIFLESTRPGISTGWNLWAAVRDDASVPWGEPVEVDELNSMADDIDPWLSPDRRTLFFASNRGGNHDIYMSVRR